VNGRVVLSEVVRGDLLNTAGSCNTMVSIIILWDHRRIYGPSLTETSLRGAYLYYAGQKTVI
jgi:hypothetical protein